MTPWQLAAPATQEGQSWPPVFGEQSFDAKLYSSVFSIFELPPQILLQIYPENFMQALIANSMIEEAEFNI